MIAEEEDVQATNWQLIPARAVWLRQDTVA